MDPYDGGGDRHMLAYEGTVEWTVTTAEGAPCAPLRCGRGGDDVMGHHMLPCEGNGPLNGSRGHHMLP